MSTDEMKNGVAEEVTEDAAPAVDTAPDADAPELSTDEAVPTDEPAPTDGPAATDDPAAADEPAPTDELAPTDGSAETDGPAATDAPSQEKSDAETADPEDSAAAEPGAAASSDNSETDSKSRGRPRLKLDELVVGTETRGKVVGISKFGAFVDVGAVTDGLVHISELGEKKVKNVEDVVSPGKVVDVWVKDVDLKKSRISLSMRRKPVRPMQSLQAGDVVRGKVTSITKYGAFVDIGAETEGLVHVSEMSSGFVDNPRDIAEPGQEIEVRVKEIDRRRERISLSMVGLADDSRAVPEDVGAPMERQPTVVELALRKALGEMEDEDDGGDTVDAAGRPAPSTELAERFSQMLSEYRQKSE